LADLQQVALVAIATGLVIRDISAVCFVNDPDDEVEAPSYVCESAFMVNGLEKVLDVLEVSLLHWKGYNR
jgi:hypothetical protein